MEPQANRRTGTPLRLVQHSTGQANELAPGTLYFYTDGCLKSESAKSGKTDSAKHGSWSVVGVCDTQGEWEEIYSAKAGHVNANCSGQMEMRAVIEALTVASRDYKDRSICIRTDLHELQNIMSRYLATHRKPFTGHFSELEMQDERTALRKQYEAHANAEEYETIFNLLDNIGRHQMPVNIEWVRRCSDNWAERVDRESRNANTANQARTAI